MSEQLAYQTETTLHNNLSLAQAHTTTGYVDRAGMTAPAQAIQYGAPVCKPGSWSYWIGFLVGTALTIGMLVWQSQRSRLVVIIQPIPVPMTESLAVTATVGGTMPALVRMPVAGTTDRGLPALSRRTEEACTVLPATFNPPIMTAPLRPLGGRTGVWHDIC